MNNIFSLPIIKDQTPLIIFGCGKYGKIIFNYIKKNNMSKNVLCFADNAKYKINYYHNKKILKPEEAKKIYKKAVWIISSPKNLTQMIWQLRKMGIDESDILHLTEESIRYMHKYTHNYWFDEDTYFMYEYGFPINLKFIFKLFKSFLFNQYVALNFRNNIPLCRSNKIYKYNVSICAIFLNEAPYIREWIEFHRIVGIDHFYLYNNMSTDEYMDVLNTYINEGLVTLIDWDIPHGQISAYLDCVNRFSAETKWIGFIDLDEFVVPRKNKIYDFLKQYDSKYGSVLIYWKTFGSSGKKDRELNGLVIEDFKKCWPKLEDQGKCFYNTTYPLSSPQKNGQGFYHICWTQINGKNVPPINIYGKFSLPEGIQRATKAEVEIQINHYLTKSYVEYQKKILQPDATFKENTRTDMTFCYFDERATGSDNLINRYIPELKQRLGKGE